MADMWDQVVDTLGSGSDYTAFLDRFGEPLKCLLFLSLIVFFFDLILLFIYHLQLTHSVFHSHLFFPQLFLF